MINIATSPFLPVCRSRRGNALAEYGLIGSSIMVVAIAAITLTGNNIASHLGGLKGDMQTMVSSAQSAKPPSFNSPAAGVTNYGTNPGGGPLTPVTIPTPDGGTVFEPGIAEPVSTNLKEQIQTMGANGTTQFLASQIEAYIQKFLDEGRITQADANLLMKLANQGHEIGNIEGLIEKLDTAGGSASDMEDANVTYNGQQYSPKDLGLLIGWQSDKPDDIGGDPLNPGSDPGEVMQTFLDIYNEAKDSGALDDPGVYAIISELSAQIVFTGELAETFTCDNSHGEAAPGDMQNIVESEVDHYASQGICETGGYVDSGTSCKKS